jgi:O-antigen ligase
VPLVALAALGVWYGLSALWSTAPDVAVADALRVLGYAIACGIGLWLSSLVGSRLELALVPVAVAGGAAGLIVIVGALTGDDPGDFLFGDGTLVFPLGYRNANAAFFLIALWPALGLASSRDLDWRLRGLATGAATLCIAIGILCQSRGSMPAAPVALVLYLALSPHRARDLLWLLVALLPALMIVPATADLYGTGDDASVGDALDELRTAGRVLAGATAVAILAGLAWARLEPRVMQVTSRARVSWNLLVALAGVLLALGGAVAFVAKVGDPIEWFDERFEELGAGNPSRAEGQATRFGFDAGSNRTDLWRVALDQAADEPLKGGGGGSFRYRYVLERDVPRQYAVDAHSVVLEVFSELGLVGLALLLLAVGGLLVAALRALRLGPVERALAAAVIAATGYWLVHASVDWFWPYPVVTAPVFFLLGAAAGPLARGGRVPLSRRARVSLGAFAALLALTVLPPFMAQRYVDAAYEGWRSDPARAYRDLGRAADLNPLADEPLLGEGAIARAAGDRARAIEAFERAVAERPEEYAGYYFLALLYRKSDPQRAQAALAKVRQLDPLNPDLERLEAQVRGAP